MHNAYICLEVNKYLQLFFIKQLTRKQVVGRSSKIHLQITIHDDIHHPSKSRKLHLCSG